MDSQCLRHLCDYSMFTTWHFPSLSQKFQPIQKDKLLTQCCSPNLSMPTQHVGLISSIENLIPTAWVMKLFP